MSMGLSSLFTISFLLGLCIDIFSDTPGVNALACTLVAAVKRPVFYAYIDKDDHTKRIIPSVSTMGLGKYSKYLLTMTVIYCLLLFSIEYFNFADVKDIVILTGASALLSFIILLATECLIFSKS